MREILKLFRELNNNVNYCHWKSITKLRESFLGKTDFDLLVDEKDARKFKSILFKYGARQVLPRNWMIYPSMEDFLMFDESSGSLYHFHVHYRLIMGNKLLKEYLIPLEKYILKNRVFCKSFDTFVIAPEVNLVVEILRLIQKIKLLRFSLKVNLQTIPEIKYLVGQIEEEKYFRTLMEIDKVLLFDGKLYSYFVKIYQNQWNIDYYSLIRMKLLLESYSRYSFHERIFIRAGRKLANFISSIKSRNNAKHFVESGVEIALVGVDGSGKTTIADALVKKLRYKLSAKKYYLGCNKRSYSLVARLIIFLSYFLRMAKFCGKRNKVCMNLHLLGILLVEFACLHDRKYKYKKAKKDVANGMIIIYERFPLRNTIDYPHCFINNKWAHLTNKWAINRKLENFLKREYSKFRLPKLTFWLKVSPDLIKKRRRLSERDYKVVCHKYGLLKKYYLTNGGNLFILDAAKPVSILTNSIIGKLFE